MVKGYLVMPSVTSVPIRKEGVMLYVESLLSPPTTEQRPGGSCDHPRKVGMVPRLPQRHTIFSS